MYPPYILAIIGVYSLCPSLLARGGYMSFAIDLYPRRPSPAKVVSFKFDDSWWAGVSIDLGCGEVKGHMHLSTGHGCATLPVPPQAAWNTSMPPGLRPRLGSGLPLPPAQHVFDRLHREYVTPSGMVDCGQHQHAPGLWPSSR